MTPLGVGKLTSWHDGTGAIYEATYAGPISRLSFAVPSHPDNDYLERALGCVLMWELLPSGYVHDAFTALCKTYRFAREDEELSPPQEVHSLSRGIAVGTDDFDW